MAFPAFADQNKIRLGFSEISSNIIQEDMYTFGVDLRGTFINQIFSNYAPIARASLGSRIQERIDSLRSDDQICSISSDSKSVNSLISHIAKTEFQDIFDMISLRQGTRHKGALHYINEENKDYLTDPSRCNENRYYESPRYYIEAVIEEYCALPFIKREEIYYLHSYKTVRLAIERHLTLDVIAQNGTHYHVFPYKFLSDGFNSRSYLACMTQLAERHSEKKPASLRVPNLKRISLLENKNSRLSSEDARYLEELIKTRNIQFLTGLHEEIHVVLTDNGVKLYNSILWMRPTAIQILNGHEYVFQCTQRQITNYFIKFGADAFIKSPQKLQNEFRRMYSEASRLYNENL